jgi:hypothetical protein
VSLLHKRRGLKQAGFSAAVYRVSVLSRVSLVQLSIVVALVSVALFMILSVGEAEARLNRANDKGHDLGWAQVSPSPTPDPACGLVWRVVSAPNPSSTQNHLGGVAAISVNDAWTVGLYSVGIVGRTLAHHWDGTHWNQTNSINVGTDSDVLSDVEAVSSIDVWAVGHSKSNGPDQPLIEHWNGSEWSATLIPMLDGGTLVRLSVVSSADIWAVGSRIEVLGGAGVNRTLTMHWDGLEWTVVPTPFPVDPDQDEWLRGVSAVSSDDVWSVGNYYDSLSNSYTLALHWDGSVWSYAQTPNPGHHPWLWAVTAVATNDVWAVGSTGNRTLVLHWNGTEWSQVPSPSPEVDASYLQAATEIDENDVRAVGYSCCPQRSLVLHWDGIEWSISANPNPGAHGNIFFDSSASSGTDVWAVGNYRNCNGCPYLTLTERYSDPCVTPTATVTGTPPTNTPQSTRTQTATVTPTSILTATPTACPIQFSDVPSSNTFYTQVRCLVCRGIVSGYSDGTFRPNNQVTRGQLAKMVSNSAGFSEDPNPQIFADVPPSNTFYEWVNRLTRRGYMSGYLCGGPGEPCINNMPYFRPFANATRGQTSKIVSNAAGFTETHTGQTFEDVPPTQTFYQEIQRLATRNVMGGYECGRPGEPCIAPENRPYFRPNNDVTRGQSAKIVANTFFPDCETLVPR